MTAWGMIVAVLLSCAALLALARMVRGPAVLDRIVAAEALLSLTVAAIGTEAALHRHATTLPILVVISLLGFVGSVAVVRFGAGEEA
ncbi:monovalent cation/H+ antiporter complex subunit F [Plantactinospora sp. KBS50]|uniref:monovalent cation/H+ antiporter complex subunit F n=1 Tax=Plantactinospora sp. KBS50 TaxID=2024580 RepID=UPI001E49626A|nr:monovalent cation/H+ antiporter complex subunit F [Plantactinospora sp. KBS50]